MSNNFETQPLSIVDELAFCILDNESIKKHDGLDAACEHWTEVRQKFIFGDPGMPDEVFADFANEALRKLAQLKKEGLNL